MAQAFLVAPDLDAGRKFVDLLNRSGVPITAALWQCDESMDANQWELDLVSPLVDEAGIKEAYRKMLAVLDSTGDPPLLNGLDVRLYSPKEPFLKSLRRTFKGKRDIKLGGGPVGDHILDPGYLYFVK